MCQYKTHNGSRQLVPSRQLTPGWAPFAFLTPPNVACRVSWPNRVMIGSSQLLHSYAMLQTGHVEAGDHVLVGMGAPKRGARRDGGGQATCACRGGVCMPSMSCHSVLNHGFLFACSFYKTRSLHKNSRKPKASAAAMHLHTKAHSLQTLQCSVITNTWAFGAVQHIVG